MSFFKFVYMSDVIRQRMGHHLSPRSLLFSDSVARSYLVHSAQLECFPDVLSKLKHGSALSDNHPISDLAPQIDIWGLIRVGGRLRNSNIAFSVKHPLLIPQKHPLSSILISHFHILNKHQGSHITHNAIIQNGYYIQNGRRLIRNHINSCVICSKLRAKTSEQLIADSVMAAIIVFRCVLASL